MQHVYIASIGYCENKYAIGKYAIRSGSPNTVQNRRGTDFFFVFFFELLSTVIFDTLNKSHSIDCLQTDKVLLSWPSISTVFNWLFEFHYLWCVWQLISDLSKYVSKMFWKSER